MNWLDRAIGAVAPGAGLRRARQRQMIAVLARAYEGARAGRRTEGWVAAGTGANAEIAPAIARLRDRSRDLVRNNPYAAKAVTALVSNMVGTGLLPRARAEAPEVAAQADRLWSEFSGAADADGLTDFAGLQALIVRSLVESGEVLVRLRERRVEDALPVPLQLQVLEADHLDGTKTEDLRAGGFVLQGIEFDALGRRRAYWLYPTHPGDGRGALVSHRVPATHVLHLFERLRPGQVRGVTWFAPVMLKLRDLDAYDEAELVRKKIEACFAAFVTGVQDEETLGKARVEADGRRIETFEPGMIEYLEPGRDVKFASPSASGGYAEYMRLQLHAIAAGVGLTYELLTGDLSQVNYSSIRAGLIEFRRRMEALQWQLLVPGLCAPVWRRFVLAAQAAGKLPDGEIGAEWTAPRFEAVDPMKDIQADILAVRAGVMTLKEAIARQGYEPAQVLAEIAAINAELDALGITLDTDPRRSTRTGNGSSSLRRSRMPAKPPDHHSAAHDVAMPRVVDLPLQTRADVRLMPETVDVERRTVEVVWSTGAAVRRRDPWTVKRYDEVLSLEESHVDLSRLNGGAPLLNTHGAWDLRDVIGVVERAWIAREGEALVGHATVRFSDRADVEPIWRDVVSGIVRNVSVGYAVRTYEITETDGQPPVWRAIDWQPLELSAVPIGADAAAGFRAAGQPAQPATHPCHLLRRTPAPTPEEPTMTREAETETTPPEAVAAAAGLLL